MKKYLLSLMALFYSFFNVCSRIAGIGNRQKIDQWFGNATGWFVNFIFYQIPFSEEINVYWVLFPLILGASYFTIYFKFINFRGFWTSINIVRGKYEI